MPRLDVRMFRSARSLSSLAAVAALLLAPLAPPPAPPSSPQDGSVRVPPGRQVHEHRVLTAGIDGVFELAVKTDEVLHAHVSAEDFDPVLELRCDGNVLATVDDDGATAAVRRRFADAGKAELRVRGAGAASAGRYALSIERYVAPPIAPGEQEEGTFGRECWRHFRVALRAGDLLAVAGPCTAMLPFPVPGPVPETLGAYEAPRDGEYHLRLEGPEGSRFRLRTALAQRHDVAAGAPREATLGPLGFDVLRLRLAKGSVYTVELAADRDALPFELRAVPEDDEPDAGPAFAHLPSSGKGGCQRRTLLLLRDASFEALARNPDEGQVPYRFELRREDERLAGGEAARRVLPLGGHAVFAFEAEIGQLVAVGAASEAFDATLTIVGPDGTRVAVNDDRGPLRRDAEAAFVARSAGVHRAVVSAAGGGGGGAFTVRAAAAPLPELAVGGALRLDVENPGAGAVARLALAEGQEVWLSARSRAFDCDVSVLGPDGALAARRGDGGLGGDVLFAFRAPHEGPFFVQVHGHGAGGPCELRALAP